MNVWVALTGDEDNTEVFGVYSDATTMLAAITSAHPGVTWRPELALPTDPDTTWYGAGYTTEHYRTMPFNDVSFQAYLVSVQP